MTESPSVLKVHDAMNQYGLSARAAQNSLPDSPWDALEKMLGNLWSPENPQGLVFLGVADNPFMHEEVATYIKDNLAVDPEQHLTYGLGPRGSPRLRKALASFFTTELDAHQPIQDQEIVILSGVMAVLDALAWSVCDEGEGIIVPLPFYTGFKPGVGERARGVLLPAPFQSLQGYQSLDDVFDPEMNIRALDGAFLKAREDGVNARAVMISNPHNPLGRCYPETTLKAIDSFCGRNGLHLIVDQIFATSVYDNPRGSDVVPFTAITAINLDGHIDPNFVHTAYGMGKDFSATGLRIGVLHSRNRGLLRAVSSISVFGWVPYITQDIWAKMLDDKPFLRGFMEKKRRILSERCSILISFLEEHDIPYHTKLNAGVFVWVDLRRYLSHAPGRGEAAHKSVGLTPEQLSSSELALYRERETMLFKRCIAGGVGISLGSSFGTEELGWFRISFNVDERALHVALERLSVCLKAIMDDGWEQMVN